MNFHTTRPLLNALVPLILLATLAVTPEAQGAGSKGKKGKKFPLVNPVQFSIVGGISYGGDDISDPFTVNIGDDSSTSHSIKAGNLLLANARATFNFSNSFGVHLGAGYQVDTIKADNGSMEFSRNKIELIPFYRTEESFRLGLGITADLGPTYNRSVDGSADEEITFDDALGAVFDVSYDPLKSPFTAGFKLQYVDYVDSESGDEYAGSHGALYLGLEF